MKFPIAASLSVLLAIPASAAEAGRPAYRLAEGLSDGIYGLMRGHLFAVLLPRRLAGRMAAAPAQDSYEAFSARLSRNHKRVARRAMAARPAPSEAGPVAEAKWRGVVLDEEQDALTGSFAATMVDRYQLENFGKESGSYALNPANWEPGFLASASVLGGAYLWAAGVDADVDAGPLNVGVRLAPGWRWRAAAGGNGRRLASLDVSPRGGDLTLRAEWGASGPEAEKVSLLWERRF